jgi:hypothetical protein
VAASPSDLAARPSDLVLFKRGPPRGVAHRRQCLVAASVTGLDSAMADIGALMAAAESGEAMMTAIRHRGSRRLPTRRRWAQERPCDRRIAIRKASARCLGGAIDEADQA